MWGSGRPVDLVQIVRGDGQDDRRDGERAVNIIEGVIGVYGTQGMME